MEKLLIHVNDCNLINGHEYLIAEPLITNDGVTDFASQFIGNFFVITQNETIPLGYRQLLLTLFEQSGDGWQLSGTDLPEIPYVLTNDPSLRIIFDQIITFVPSELIRHRLKYSKWKSFAIKIGDNLGVLCPVKRKKLGVNRMIIVGKDEFKLDCSVQIVDIDDTDEILGDSVQIL